MRVLLVHPGPSFSVADVHDGWLRAFRQLGCEVVGLNLHDRLDFYSQAQLKKRGRYIRAFDSNAAVQMAAKGIEVAAFEFWPDIVVVVSGFFVPAFTYDILRARGMKVVLLCTESPYEDEGQLMRAPHADVVLLNDPTNLERFRAVNPATHYVPHAYDPEIHHPRAPDPKAASDFCFVGTGYPSRVEFFEQVDFSGIDVALAGNWGRLKKGSPLRPYVVHGIKSCIQNSRAQVLYASSKASANIYRVEAERDELAQGWAMSPREVELSATGCFWLAQPRGENQEVLPFVPTFDGPEDFEDKLRWYLDRPDEREVIADKARGAVSDRTFENNTKRLLSLL